MNEIAAFDAIAAEYDRKFSETLIGKEQRQLSRQWLKKVLGERQQLQILEINCGTGDDALWLASLGHSVTATDRSTAMIRQARAKLFTQTNVEFIACDFRNLLNKLRYKRFDLIFSNFSGLNCIPPNEMVVLASDLFALLKPKGYLATVVFGKHTWWEMLFFLLKGQPRNAFRRWSKGTMNAAIAKDVYQPVYYYSVRHLKDLLAPFQLIQKKAVGLFIPPTYMEHAMQKRPNLFQSLTKLEKKMNGAAITGSFADHVFLVFKK